MPNRSINSLDNTSTLATNDLLVLWKASANAAYNISGQDFTSMLLSLASGRGGITSIAKTSSSGTNPVVDTYTITYADTTTSTFTVTNGVKGDTGAQTYVFIRYSEVEPTQDSDIGVVPAAWMGVQITTNSTASTHYTDYTWNYIKGAKGDGITDIVRTGGDGTPGSTDVYTAYVGDDPVGTFDVYQGINGDGAVNTINDIYPDGDGNVELYKQNILYKPLTSRTILLLGDSYNHGDGGVVPHGWGYYFNQFNGTSGTIIQQGGGGFAAEGGSGAAYPNKTFAQVIGELDQSSNYDLIIAQAGWNDANPDKNPSGAPAIFTGVANFVTAVSTKWPNAEIIIIPTFNSDSMAASKETCLKAIAEAAFDNGIRSSSQSYLWLKAGGYTATDNVHLNDAGYQALATYITRFVKGWDGVVSRPHTMNTVTVTGTTNGSGAIALSGTIADKHGVISARCTNIANCVCVPWKYSNGNWWCWCQKWDDRTFFTNTAVTLDVTYIEG